MSGTRNIRRPHRRSVYAGIGSILTGVIFCIAVLISMPTFTAQAGSGSVMLRAPSHGGMRSGNFGIHRDFNSGVIGTGRPRHHRQHGNKRHQARPYRFGHHHGRKCRKAYKRSKDDLGRTNLIRLVKCYDPHGTPYIVKGSRSIAHGFR